MGRKTNKSLSKRLRLTKRGKVLARRPGQNHFRAKKDRSIQLNQKRANDFVIGKKDLMGYMPHK